MLSAKLSDCPQRQGRAGPGEPILKGNKKTPSLQPHTKYHPLQYQNFKARETLRLQRCLRPGPYLKGTCIHSYTTDRQSKCLNQNVVAAKSLRSTKKAIIYND